MSDEQPTVPIRCEQCGTETRLPLDTVGDALDRHNETRHDGEQVATVDPAIRELGNLLAAADLGLKEEA